jgi:hypothetical protein
MGFEGKAGNEKGKEQRRKVEGREGIQYGG